MKTKSLALGVVMAVALCVAGESVVVLDSVGRVAAASSRHIRTRFAKSDATHFAQHVVRVLGCVAKI